MSTGAVSPTGHDNPQQACNIAGYLAFVVIKQAMLQAVNAIQNDLGIINFGLTLIRLIPGVGWAYIGFAAAISGFLTDIASGSLTDYQNAIGGAGALVTSYLCDLRRHPSRR